MGSKAADENCAIAFTQCAKALSEYTSKTASFNLFEAIGIGHQEIKHAHLLHYLLSSDKPHTLGTDFLACFLRACGIPFPSTQTLDSITLYREKHNIDLLLLDEEAHYGVVIEMKVWAKETGQQLQAYYDTMRLRYPDITDLHLRYITPAGLYPSSITSEHKDHAYLPVSFHAIYEAISTLCETQRYIPDEVSLCLTHYQHYIKEHVTMDAPSHQQKLALYDEYHPIINEVTNAAKQASNAVYTIVKDKVTHESQCNHWQWIHEKTESKKRIHLFPSQGYDAFKKNTHNAAAWNDNYKINFEIDLHIWGQASLNLVIDKASFAPKGAMERALPSHEEVLDFFASDAYFDMPARAEEYYAHKSYLKLFTLSSPPNKNASDNLQLRYQEQIFDIISHANAQWQQRIYDKLLLGIAGDSKHEGVISRPT